MRKYILFLCSMTLGILMLQGQDFQRALEEVDFSQIRQTASGSHLNTNAEFTGLVADIINQTSLDSLVTYVRIVSGEDSVMIGDSMVLIQNRGTVEGRALASEYLKEKLASYDLDVYEQAYSSTGKNIYAIQPGSLYPKKHFILCAHYDAVTYYAADDNASGVAAVIEAARILSQYDLEYTIIYAFWDEEEIGLIGSAYYAAQAASHPDNIQGVLNLDMIGWDGNNDGLADIHTRNIGNSNDLADMLMSVNVTYDLPLNPIIYNPGSGASDHASFWTHGYGAVLLIEAFYGGDFNPFYHTPQDRIDKFNLGYFHNMSKLAIGTISTLAGVTPATFVDYDITRPSDFHLGQNYPNPFNPSTVIRYGLPARSHVKLKIYNTLGQRVATLVNEELEAGYHNIEWYSGNAASGMYFYRIEAASVDNPSNLFVETRRMILLK